MSFGTGFRISRLTHSNQEGLILRNLILIGINPAPMKLVYG